MNILDQWEAEAKEVKGEIWSSISGSDEDAISNKNERIITLIEVVRMQRNALKQCRASTSVLSAIESENANIKGMSTKLGGYTDALTKSCEQALAYAERILK